MQATFDSHCSPVSSLPFPQSGCAESDELKEEKSDDAEEELAVAVWI